MKLNCIKPSMVNISFAVMLCISLLFTSCNYSAKKKELIRQQAIADSLERVAAEEVARIEKARIDSLALIAWGDTRFGMSPTEVLTTTAFKNSEKYKKGRIMSDGRRSRSYISMEYDDRRKFENNMDLALCFLEFDACFRSDELTSIIVKSYDYSASYINDIERDARIWSSNFTKKYGEPFSKKSDVSILDFERGREFTYASWTIGDKYISISMGEVSSGSEYYYEVYIHHNGFPTKPDIEEEESIKKYQEKKKAETASYF